MPLNTGYGHTWPPFATVGRKEIVDNSAVNFQVIDLQANSTMDSKSITQLLGLPIYVEGLLFC